MKTPNVMGITLSGHHHNNDYLPNNRVPTTYYIGLLATGASWCYASCLALLRPYMTFGLSSNQALPRKLQIFHLHFGSLDNVFSWKDDMDTCGYWRWNFIKEVPTSDGLHWGDVVQFTKNSSRVAPRSRKRWAVPRCSTLEQETVSTAKETA